MIHEDNDHYLVPTSLSAHKFRSQQQIWIFLENFRRFKLQTVDFPPNQRNNYHAVFFTCTLCTSLTTLMFVSEGQTTLLLCVFQGSVIQPSCCSYHRDLLSNPLVGSYHRHCYPTILLVPITGIGYSTLLLFLSQGSAIKPSCCSFHMDLLSNPLVGSNLRDLLTTLLLVRILGICYPTLMFVSQGFAIQPSGWFVSQESAILEEFRNVSDCTLLKTFYLALQ